MKKAISIGLIFILSAPCLYQIGIVTYFQINRDYVAQVLCINKEKPMTMCYGNCFLDRNLKLADDSDNSSKSSAPPVKQNKIEIPIFIVSDFLIPLGSFILMPSSHTKYQMSSCQEFPIAIFHPPSIS